MSVTLTIEDDRRDALDGPDVSEIPNGARILIRRCANGADVLVLPGKGAGARDVPARAAEPEPVREGDRMLVQHLVVHNRPGKVEIVVTDLSGLCFSLILASDLASSLGQCLTAFLPSPALSHEEALARRATVEAELLELDLAERRRAALDADVPMLLATFGATTETGAGTVKLALRDKAGRVVRIEAPLDQALNLSEDLTRMVRLAQSGGSA